MTEQHPAGWYDDGSGQQRWFDGQAWTEQTRIPPISDGVPPTEPPTYIPPATQWPPTYAPTPPAAPTTQGIAIAALITGIVAFVTGLAPVWGILAGGAAVVLGILALRRRQPRGMAIAGIVLGALALLASTMTTLGMALSTTALPAHSASAVATTSSPALPEVSATPDEASSPEVSDTPRSEDTTASPSDDEGDEMTEDEDATADDPGYTMAQEQAIDKANEYLDYTAFSEKGLIAQLKFEGFSKADATFAVEHIEVDWNEQAALKAQEYLDYTSFSRSGLIKQLEFEGFTHKQAVHGVDAVGL